MSRCVKTYVLIFFVWFCTGVCAQSPSANADEDLKRCLQLAKLSEESAEGEWQKYSKELMQLAAYWVNKLPEDDKRSNAFKKHYALGLNNCALDKQNLGDIDAALEFFRKSYALYTEAGEVNGAAECLGNIALMYQSLGKIAEALNSFKTAIAMQEKAGDFNGLATTYNNIGQLYNAQGNVPLALEYCLRSNRILEKQGDKEKIAYSLIGIGFIYSGLGDNEQALACYMKSIKPLEESGDQYGLCGVLLNIAGIYREKGLYEQALEMGKRALLLSAEASDKTRMANAYNAISMIYFATNKSDSAFMNSNKALKMWEELNDKDGQASTYINMGDYYLRFAQYKLAGDYATKALEIGKALGFPDQQRNAARILYKTALKAGDYKAALKHYELFIVMKDSLERAENKKAGIRSQLQYEYDKKTTADSVRVAEEKKVTAARLQSEKTQRYSLYGGLALVAVFALFMTNRFRVTSRQKKEIEQQKKTVEQQKHIVEEKQKEILDSIYYAKRIQQAIMVSEQNFQRALSKSGNPKNNKAR